METRSSRAGRGRERGGRAAGAAVEVPPPPPSLLLPLPVSLLYTPSLPPYCCPYPCPYCTLPPSLPTVAPTRVPTVHSLPPSLLLPLPVSLLYTPSLPPYCCPYPCPYCTLTPSLPSRFSSPTASTGGSSRGCGSSACPPPPPLTRPARPSLPGQPGRGVSALVRGEGTRRVRLVRRGGGRRGPAFADKERPLSTLVQGVSAHRHRVCCPPHRAAPIAPPGAAWSSTERRCRSRSSRGRRSCARRRGAGSLRGTPSAFAPQGRRASMAPTPRRGARACRRACRPEWSGRPRARLRPHIHTPPRPF